MACIERKQLEKIIFGHRNARRYTQDSPVLPDVWFAFSENPKSQVGLIIQPHRKNNAGETAVALRDRLQKYRKSQALEQRERAEIAHLPGIVVLRLHFDELIHVALPFTGWWEEIQSSLNSLFATSVEKTKSKELKLLSENIRKLREVDQTGDRFEDSGEHSFNESMIRLAILIATIHDAADQNTKAGNNIDDWPAEQVAKAFLNLIDRWSEPIPPLKNQLIFNLGRNRDAVPTINRSAVATKADAARLLFNVSCKNITWAVADSGIEHRHPAFHNWRHNECGSRVVRTYDFTRLRSLLSIDIPEEIRLKKLLGILRKSSGAGLTEQQEQKNKEALDAEYKRQIKELLQRIDQGHDIDWALLEQFIRLDQKDINALPGTDHGTHVAGILGADWPCPVTQEENYQDVWTANPCRHQANEQIATEEANPRFVSTEMAGSDQSHVPVPETDFRKMTGMCPDISLIDLRVLRHDNSPADARSDEFEVMAALQFVRYLNARAGYIKVHGINLSLSVDHDVANYACGRTPICLECDETVSSGVVVVAAAGNNGYRSDSSAGSQGPGSYHTVSITDPGNAEKVITVGATHRYKPHEFGVSYFSSRGPTGDGRRKPDLVAPGEKIDGPTGIVSEGRKDGTSMAAPHISGAAALLMARHPELIGKPEKIKEILCSTATDLGREHYYQGYGMLDVLRALQSV